MCELLILDKDNWMDALTQEQIDAYKAKDKNFQQKYDARSKKGDVIEIREDGGFKNADKYTHFRVVKIPNVPKSQAEYLMSQERENTPDGEATILKKKRIYTVNTGDGKKVETATNLISLSITDKRV